MPDIDSKKIAKLGKRIRKSDNDLVGSFAAEMAGESYPFSKSMCEIMFESFTDEQLGRKFAEWHGWNRKVMKDD